MIKVEKVTKRFGRKIVLNELSLTIPDGEIFGLIGPSGSGKSVLSKCIAGLLSLDSGVISVDGITELPRNVGYVFQFGGLFDSLTLMDNIVFLPKVEGSLTRELCEYVVSVCEQLKIAEFLDKEPKSIPLSARKLGALIRALISDVRWIFIDEPDSGLDPENVESLYNVIKTTQSEKKKNLVVVSHDVPDVFQICTSYGLIYSGKIVSSGKIQDGKVIQGDEYINQFLNGYEHGPIRFN